MYTWILTSLHVDISLIHECVNCVHWDHQDVWSLYCIVRRLLKGAHVPALYEFSMSLPIALYICRYYIFSCWYCLCCLCFTTQEYHNKDRLHYTPPNFKYSQIIFRIRIKIVRNLLLSSNTPSNSSNTITSSPNTTLACRGEFGSNTPRRSQGVFEPNSPMPSQCNVVL